MNTLKFLSQFQNNAPINALLLILSKVTGSSTTALLIKDELNLTSGESSEFMDYISKLGSGMPLAYLLGEWGFYDRLFYVNSNVLIPRPDTEQIIDLTLAQFPAFEFCTDNAAMIGAAAHYRYLQGAFTNLDIDVQPNWEIRAA